MSESLVPRAVWVALKDFSDGHADDAATQLVYAMRAAAGEAVDALREELRALGSLDARRSDSDVVVTRPPTANVGAGPQGEGRGAGGCESVGAPASGKTAPRSLSNDTPRCSVWARPSGGGRFEVAEPPAPTYEELRDALEGLVDPKGWTRTGEETHGEGPAFATGASQVLLEQLRGLVRRAGGKA